MHRWICWNIFFRLQEAVKRHTTFAILRDMEAADRMSVSQFQEARNRRLRDFICYGHQHVPYVKRILNEASVDPSRIGVPEDLVKIPLMTKSDVRQYRVELRSDVAGKLSTFATGGSTGEPLILDLAERRISSRVACRQRVARWWGATVGDPELTIWGAPIELTSQDWLRRMRDWVMSIRLLSAYEMDEATMAEYVRVMESGRWRQIFAYPSAVYRLCQFARAQGKNLRHTGIRVVFVTSEMLYDYQRDLIVETFGCPVANGYGGRDSGFIAHECPQGGMHVMADAVITEILDAQGRPVKPGEIGRIVVTDLYSHEFPFLRYVTGDLGMLSSRPCVCGRPLPLFERIEGRSNDSVVTADGRVMHGQSLISLLMEIPGVEQFRICQKSVDRLHVQLVRNDRYRDESEERLRKGWSERLRTPLQVTFEYLPALPHERSGKFRHIVSEIQDTGSKNQLSVN